MTSVTGSLIPAQIDMHAVQGGDFAATINFYTDVNQTTPFDLTGFTISLNIGNGLLILTPGSGLTVTALSGQIDVVLTDTQTASTLPNAQHYFVKLVDGGGLISFPVAGELTVLAP